MLDSTPTDVADLRALAASLEAEARVHYEDFLFQRRVDGSMWEPLDKPTDGSLVAFRERPSHGRAPLGPQAALAAHTSLGRVLVVGSVAGSVDDAMFGGSAHDSASVRVRAAYERESWDHSAVVVSVDTPSLKDPFRFFGLTWYARGAGHDRRAYHLLERTHLTTLSTGERVGVQLRHSVDPARPPRASDPSTNPRAIVSSVTFLRDVEGDKVEVFSLGLSDEQGSSVVDGASRACTTGFQKKLVWFLEQQQKRYHPAAALPTSSAKSCGLCRRDSNDEQPYSESGAACILCAKHVCAQCFAIHEIVLDASEADVELDAFAFCNGCLATVNKLPTQRIAREQVVHEREQPQP